MKEHKFLTRNVSDLIPYINNARTHSDEQVAQVAASIKEFGFTNPVLIDENSGIIAGHGRIMAAKKLDITSVPCIELCGLTEAQKKAYVIADNQLALNSGWDLDVLRLEVETLQDMEFDLQLTGFSLDEINNLIFDSDNECESLEAQNYEEKFSIVIDCNSEEEQEELFIRLKKEGYSCRVQSL